jgi:hypothetical protein
MINTSRDERHPEWLSGGDPEAIDAQEAQGQSQLVVSELLPTKIRGSRGILERAGVVFGDPLPDDPLFCRATLPPGWNKRATDHPMWSELVDETGRVRAMIFYKAAFYDRDAFVNVEKEPTP